MGFRVQGLNISIPITIPIKGRGFIDQGSGLGQFRVLGYAQVCQDYKGLF